MKKTIFITLSIIFVLGVAIAMIFLVKPKTVYATDIVLNSNKIVMQVDEEIYLPNSYNITPSNYTDRPVFSSSNENVATVGIFDGKLIAKSVGITTIIITIKTSATKTKTARLDVEVIAKKIYPTNVDISVTELNFIVGESRALQIHITGTTNILPTITTINGCVTYDAITDTITAVKTGEDVLTICYVLANGTTKTFDINIFVADKTTYTKSVTISLSGDNYTYLEYFTDSLKSECEISVIEGSDVVSVVEFEYKHFAIVALKAGSAKIVVDSPTSINTFYITIIL